MDINPTTRGHALVVPRRHVTNLPEVQTDDLTAVMLGRPAPGQGVTKRLG